MFINESVTREYNTKKKTMGCHAKTEQSKNIAPGGITSLN